MSSDSLISLIVKNEDISGKYCQICFLCDSDRLQKIEVINITVKYLTCSEVFQKKEKYIYHIGKLWYN